VLDAEGIPWETDGPDDFSAPSGLAYDGAPGESLVELAERLHDAVRSHLKDGMYDECVVDMSPFGIEECYGDVSNAVAEVMVAATSVETAGQFNMALRRKELRRLRAALWDLRVVLESKAGGCTITIRHRLESLRSASLDVCHPKMRAADAPSPSAIPNFQTVHQRFEMDAVPSAGEALFGTDDFDEALGPAKAADPGSSGECELDGPEVAFYRGGQPTAEGRSWLVSKGFKTVVDLRFEDRENQWTRPLGGGAGVGKLGEESLEVIHLPVTDMTPPSYEDVEKFIAIANDRTKRPMFVHCKAGIGRTGSVVSCWRISRGMPVDDALELESLNCDFGSLAQEAFVREFADRLARKAAGSWDEEDDERAKRVSEAAKITAAAAAEEAGKATDDKAAAAPPPKAAANTANASAAVYEVEKAPKVEKPPHDPSPATPTYEGAEYFEEDASSSRAPTMRTGPEGMGSGGMSAEMLERGVSAVGEHSRLDAAPDMYVIRTDGFTCTREEVDDRMLKISHPSTQQLVLVWRKPPKRIFILKKLGGALLGNLVEVAHAFVSMGFEVIVEEGVMNEMRSASEALDEERLRANEVTSSRADEVREAVLRRAETLAIDEKTGRIPETAWGTIDLVVCLGGDGVILHASKLFQGPVPPLMGFHFGSMGFLTNHPPDRMAQSLLQAVGRGPKKVANVKGGIPITLRMRLQCTLVKKKDSARNGGSGAASHSYTVLNEVLVDRGPSPFLSKIEAYDRGQLITTIQADGVMLATATGSTAYSVSAGGSMVHPNVPAILMTPICPHTLSFRPVVLPDSVEVELRVADDARQSAWVSFDGKERCELCSGDSIFIRMSEFPVPTVNYEDQTGDFIGSLRRCLRWNERDEQKPLDEAAMRELRKIADGD
jgi:NAD+ kinase